MAQLAGHRGLIRRCLLLDYLELLNHLKELRFDDICC